MKTRLFGFGALAVTMAASILFGARTSNVVIAARATAAATAKAVATTNATNADDITRTTLVRVVDAAPDAPNVDVYLDTSTTPTIANLSLENPTVGYVPLAAGDHQVTITPAGDAKTVIYDQKLTLPGGTAVTLIAEGLRADKSFGIRVTVDDVSPTNGKARVEVIHAVADGPSVDLATADFKTTLVTALPFGYSRTITLDPGTYDLVVVPTGKHTPVVVDLKGVKLDADQIYAVFATGKLSEIVRPLLFITAPIPGFQPPAAATPEGTMAATASK